MAPHQIFFASDARRRVSAERSPLLSALATYLSTSLVQCRLRNPWDTEVVGELLEGTLLFADISGFTTLSEQLAPHGKEGAEELTFVLNAFFDRMIDIIAAHNGDVLQFGGDALVIVFGALPVAAGTDQQAHNQPPQREVARGTGFQPVTERDPELPGKMPVPPAVHSRFAGAALDAVRCGLHMQSAMHKFEQLVTSVGTFRLGMSIGVHHGRFLLASAGSWNGHLQQVVLGKTLNRLLKVESLADRGDVLVSAAARRLLRKRVPLEKQWNGCFRVVAPPSSIQPARPTDQRFPSAFEQLDQVESPTALEMASRYLIPAVYRRIAEDPAGYANEGEHRFIATMFVNFSGMGEVMRRFGNGRIPEVVHYLDAYLAGMTQIIVGHGGALARVSADVHGDKLLVLFGAPVAIENPEQRALRCALEMNRRVQELNAASPVALEQRIGIASGSAFCGNVGSDRRREYTVIADQANTAARLAVQGDAFEILVSRSVWHKAHESFRFRRQGPVRLRGKQHADEVYQLLAPRERPLPGPHWKRRLVGRGAQRREFRGIVDQVLKGKGQVLVVSGEAGIGKSRLVQQFVARCRAAGMTGLVGHCDPYGSSVPYFPWGQVLRRLLGIGRQDLAELTSHKLEARLADFSSELAAWAPLLGTMMGASFADNEHTSGLTPRQRKEKVFSLCLELLRMRARSTPIVLVLEDIHWLDPLSKELLDYLSEGLLDEPVLILAAHRPDPELAEWSTKGYVSRFELAPLSKKHTLEMLESLTGTRTVPGQLARLIHEKTQGNPLYVEEIVRALLEAKHLVWDQATDHYDFAQDAPVVDMPSTIQNLIQARVDRLSEEQRRILQFASVFGRTFPRDALRSVLPSRLSTENFEASLEELARLELIAPDHACAGHPDAFQHTLVQEVVYESLSYARRREIHRAIGEQMEQAAQGRIEENCDLLARHFDLGRVRDKAVKYLMMAGDRARRACANTEAADYFQRALMHLRALGDAREPQVLAQLLEDLADVQSLRGNYPAAVQHYQEALVRAEGPVAHARLEGKIGGVAYRQGQPRAGIEHLELGLRHLGIHAPRTRWQVRGSLLCQILVQAAHTLLPRLCVRQRGGNREAARAAIEIYETLSRISFEFDLEKTLDAHLRQLNLCESMPGSPEMAQTYSSHGIVCGIVPLFGRAIRYQQQGLAIREARRDRWGIAQSSNFMGICHYWRGQWDEALACLERSRQILHEVGDRWESEVTYLILSFIYLRRGELEQAAQHARTCLDLSQRAADPQGMGWALGALAEARSRQGKLEDALAHTLIALDCSEQAQDRMYVAVLRRVLGEVRLRMGHAEQAVEQMRSSVQQIQDYRLRHEYVLGAYAGLAESSLAVLPSIRDTATRNAALKQIGKLCRQAVGKASKFTNWLGAAYRVSALYEWAAGHPQKAARCFERSVETSRRLGSRYELAATYFDMARFLLESGRPGARDCIDQAKRVFEQCGAALDRDRVAALGAQLTADAEPLCHAQVPVHTGGRTSITTNSIAHLGETPR